MTGSSSYPSTVQRLLPWPVLLLLVLNVLPEAVLQLADRGLLFSPILRGWCYAFGGVPS